MDGAQGIYRLWLSFLLNRLQVGDKLPALLGGEAGPGRHAVGQVALTQEPLEVTVGCGADIFTVQGGALVAVASGIGFVALGAVVGVDEGAGGYGLRLAGEGIGAGVLFGWDVIKMRMSGGGKGQRGEEGDG